MSLITAIPVDELALLHLRARSVDSFERIHPAQRIERRPAKAGLTAPVTSAGARSMMVGVNPYRRSQ